MPEGPEIRIQADAIASALEGQPVEKVFFAHEHLKRYEKRLRGKTADRVRPRGKALLIEFSSGLSIYSHNQLYGRWFVRKRDSYPNTNRQLRLALHTRDHSLLLYSASDIAVLTAKGVRDHPFLSKLGPDVLDKKVTARAVASRYDDSRFRKRRLSSLLLDQGFLTGPGNYLRSEILFVAKVNPQLRPVDLKPEQLRKLASATLQISRRSYRTRGITNDPSRVKELKAAGQRRREYRHFVFARAGRPCYDCDTRIEKHSMGSRRIYVCSHCQALPDA